MSGWLSWKSSTTSTVAWSGRTAQTGPVIWRPWYVRETDAGTRCTAGWQPFSADWRWDVEKTKEVEVFIRSVSSSLMYFYLHHICKRTPGSLTRIHIISSSSVKSLKRNSKFVPLTVVVTLLCGHSRSWRLDWVFRLLVRAMLFLLTWICNKQNWWNLIKCGPRWELRSRSWWSLWF